MVFMSAPPSVPESGNEVEWLFGLDERPLAAMPEWLVNLVKQSADEPPAANDNISASSNHTLTLIRASDIEPEPIDWLWPGVLAIGKSSMIAGDPGISKSQLAIRIAATVSNGGPWPASTGTAQQGKVIILSAEDRAEDTIVPRLMAAGADRSNVLIVRALTRDGGERLFDLIRTWLSLRPRWMQLVVCP